MLIALAISNNSLASHFGHCEYFKIYDVSDDNNLIRKDDIKNPPHQKGFLPKFLNDHNIKVLITGNIGSMAVKGLNDLDIEVISGVFGNPEDVIEKYLNKTLVSTNEICEEHTHHNH